MNLDKKLQSEALVDLRKKKLKQMLNMFNGNEYITYQSIDDDIEQYNRLKNEVDIINHRLDYLGYSDPDLDFTADDIPF